MKSKKNWYSLALAAVAMWALTFMSVEVLADDPPAEDPTADDEEFLNAPTDEEAAPTDEGPQEAVTEADTDIEIETSERKRDHDKQGFVNVLFGTGVFFVAPYDKNDPDKMCGESDGESEAVCTDNSPLFLDFLGGFGVKSGLEVFAIFRLGLNKPDEYTPKTRQLGAGIRAYNPDDGLFKMGIGVAPLFDFSDRPTGKKDFVIHVPISAQFDFIPWLGAYAQVAPNFSFISEFRLEISFGLGVQGRFP